MRMLIGHQIFNKELVVERAKGKHPSDTCICEGPRDKFSGLLVNYLGLIYTQEFKCQSKTIDNSCYTSYCSLNNRALHM